MSLGQHKGVIAPKTAKSGGRSRRRKSQRVKTLEMFAEIAVLIAVVAVVIYGILQLFQRKETRTTTERRTTVAYAMTCEADAPKNPFFEVEGAQNAKHKIIVSYAEGAAGKVSYLYEAEMESAAAATAAEAATHADYNIKIGKATEKFSASFTPIEEKFRIGITTRNGVEDIDATAAEIFFISGEDFGALQAGGYQIEDLKKVIQTAGFKCEMDQKDN